MKIAVFSRYPVDSGHPRGGVESVTVVLVKALAQLDDLDVHVIIDFKKVDMNYDLVKKSVDGYRIMWNLKHNIRIKGHDVELYIQDVDEIHTSSGQYSLLNSVWLVKPKYNEPKIDEYSCELKYLTYKSGIDILEDVSKKEMSPDIAHKNHLYATEYKTKIMKERQSGLEASGEFSTENIVFKKLRNSGDIERLINVINVFYDKIWSQN